MPAHALNDVSWVSATGNDANPCTRDLPCKTFFNTQPRTQINGQIKCLDGGNFGTIAINQSLTIDCHGVAAVVHANAVCFQIIVATSTATDPAQTVKICGVTCDGLGSQSTGGIVIRGHEIAVYLQDVVITDVAKQGVLDQRNHGGVLFIKDSIIRNSGGGAS